MSSPIVLMANFICPFLASTRQLIAGLVVREVAELLNSVSVRLRPAEPR
jgi:hypothetical protein